MSDEDAPKKAKKPAAKKPAAKKAAPKATKNVADTKNVTDTAAKPVAKKAAAPKASEAKAAAPKASEAKAAAPKAEDKPKKADTKAAKPKSKPAKPAKPAPTGPFLFVEQIGSPIGRQKNQKQTLVGLGLNRVGRSRRLVDTPAVRGMIRTVGHLVRWREEGGS